MDVEPRAHPPLGTGGFLQNDGSSPYSVRKFEKLSEGLPADTEIVPTVYRHQHEEVIRSDTPSKDSCNGAQNSNANAIPMTCASRTFSLSLNRKNKPSSLDLDEEPLPYKVNHKEDLSQDVNTNAEEYKATQEEVMSEDETSSPPESPSTPMVTLSKHIVKIMDAGINSPLVRRSSRMEQILNLPDVKAALVKDEGYEMRASLHKNCPGKPLCDRLQTPCGNLEDHFKFEAESESVSGSDASSLLSSRDTLAETEPEATDDTNTDRRPRLGIIQDRKSIANPLERIADSLGPSTLFNNSVRKEQTSSPKLDNREKGQSRMKSSPQEHELPKPTPPTGRSSALLSRLRFSSMREVPARLEGWESLNRALARVGVSHPALNHLSVDDINLNPKVSPILKRVPPVRHATEEDGAPVKDPGAKPPLRKKTVSFSRLPAETKVKNAADCVSRMSDGQQFVKLRSNTRAYNRLYWLDHEQNCLRWEPSKKDPDKARILISQIKDVRSGKSTELFLTSDIACHFPDEYSFSIIYGGGKTLDLIANSADEANIWITGLRCLMSGEDAESLRSRTDARDGWLCSVFDGADINGDGFLDEDESIKLLTCLSTGCLVHPGVYQVTLSSSVRMHWKIDSGEGGDLLFRDEMRNGLQNTTLVHVGNLSDGIRELSIKQRLQEYLQVENDEKNLLSREKFISIFKDVATRPEVYFLLVRYSSNHDRLTVDDLANFLESEQGVANVTRKDCMEIITSFEPSEVLKSIPALGIDGFTKYLISDRCNLFNSKHSEVCQDMSHPLSHYFIASSHNTYLMEDQISGPSDVSAYIRALLRCCRCVELDCWDGNEGEPVVSHGHTRSNSIPFVHVIKAINESAFHNSPYPVIICIENHCSKEQQLRMAQILKDILEGNIYTESLSNTESPLPSPDSLKHKFLIRSKQLPSNCKDDVGYISEEDEGKEVTASYANNPDEEPPRVVNQVKRKQLLTRDLSDLVSICVTSDLSATPLSKHRNIYNCQHTCSIHEDVANELVRDCPEDFVSLTKRFLTRVYPSGLRRDSGNFNPQDYWNCGVQIASLNYQTPGLMMDINDGRFSMNGGCGYVLKPTVMREKLAYFNAEASDGLPSVPSKLLHLRIISGQNFPKPRGGGAKGHVIDPYVLIELFGFPPDCSDQRTRTALNNSGDSPFFDELFEFRLTLPSLALVRFVVLDDDFIGDEFIGQYTIPFDCLQPGYRHLRLRSLFDEPLEGATLFVHVAISDLDLNTSHPSMGNPTQILSGNSKITKRPSQLRLQKQRSRKEIFSVHIYDVNLPEVDAMFQSAREDLQLAASLCGGLRHSLTSLREACGASPLASVKQCIRVLAKRSCKDASSQQSVSSSRTKRKLSSLMHEDSTSRKSDARRATSSDVDTSLRRQTSDASQSSSDSGSSIPIGIQFMRNEKRIWLEWKGSSGDSWKKVGIAVDALVANCLLVNNKAMNCCNHLTSLHDKAEQIFDKQPELFQQSSSGADLQDDVVVNGSQSKKQSRAKKHPFLATVGSGGRVPTNEDNFNWNCSSIKGQRDALFACHQSAEEILTDLWSACVQYGLTGSRSTDKQSSNGSVTSALASANDNSNNNSPLLTATKNSRRRMGRLVRAGSSFTRLPSRNKAKLKRSLSDDMLASASLA